MQLCLHANSNDWWPTGLELHITKKRITVWHCSWNELFEKRSVQNEILALWTQNGLNSLKEEHIVAKGSVFGLHTEDDDLASVNLLLFGEPKIWFIVPPTHYKRVIEVVNKYVDTQCENYLRRKTLLLTPKFLENFKIPHSKVIQRPGEMVIVLSRAFHMGCNCGSNIALSVNYMPQFEVKSKRQFLRENIYCTCDANLKFNRDFTVLIDKSVN